MQRLVRDAVDVDVQLAVAGLVRVDPVVRRTSLAGAAVAVGQEQHGREGRGGGDAQQSPTDSLPTISSVTRTAATANHTIGGVPAADRIVKPAIPSIEPTMSQPYACSGGIEPEQGTERDRERRHERRDEGEHDGQHEEVHVRGLALREAEEQLVGRVDLDVQLQAS